MLTKLIKSTILGTTLVLAGTSALPAGAAEHEITISLEYGPNHILVRSLSAWAKSLEEESEGRLTVEIFHSASQHKGSAVPLALAQNALDMGMPGTWHLGKFVPDFNMPGLPVFFGRSRAEQYRIWDGEVGREMARRLEDKLGVKVLGRWFDNGFGSMFFVRSDINSHDSIKGLKIRAPGGAAHVARFRALEAAPVTISWPDVPQSLQRGTIDGLLTNHEGVRSAKLWDSGVKLAFNDNQTFFQYLPVISRQAWDSLPEELQKLLSESWERNIDRWREDAERRQASAMAENAEHGIRSVSADPASLTRVRARLLVDQAALVEELRLDPDLVSAAQTQLAD